MWLCVLLRFVSLSAFCAALEMEETEGNEISKKGERCAFVPVCVCVLVGQMVAWCACAVAARDGMGNGKKNSRPKPRCITRSLWTVAVHCACPCLCVCVCVCVERIIWHPGWVK